MNLTKKLFLYFSLILCTQNFIWATQEENRVKPPASANYVFLRDSLVLACYTILMGGCAWVYDADPKYIATAGALLTASGWFFAYNNSINISSAATANYEKYTRIKELEIQNGLDTKQS